MYGSMLLPAAEPDGGHMKQDFAILRDACDIIMHEHVLRQDDLIEKKIASFRANLLPEQKVEFNTILDYINMNDSEYAYEAFTQGMLFAKTIL